MKAWKKQKELDTKAERMGNEKSKKNNQSDCQPIENSLQQQGKN